MSGLRWNPATEVQLTEVDNAEHYRNYDANPPLIPDDEGPEDLRSGT